MMDRALKERIIGAVVLVVFVVLVVPVFLDGPPEDSEIVSERVLLPGQEDQKSQTVVLDRNRTQPVPAAATPAPAPASQEPAPQETARQEPAQEEDVPEEPKPAVVQEKPAEKVAPQPAPTQAASTTGMWAVQLGSFSNKENAEKLAADLRKQGYAAFLSQLTTESGQLHRVRIGPQKDRDSAEEMAKRLAKVGQEGQVVPHP
jgi:DedD protein